MKKQPKFKKGKTLEKIEWKVTIAGKEYGAVVDCANASTINDISEAVGVVSQQMERTIHKLVCGKTKTDILLEKYEKEFGKA